jgi:hypothetical protein
MENFKGLRINESVLTENPMHLYIFKAKILQKEKKTGILFNNKGLGEEREIRIKRVICAYTTLKM